MPKVSIIVIIYQVERFLDECLASIINQTYQNLEIILVACKGDTGCEQICDEYLKKDSRIVLIKDEPKGTAIARNAGLDVASGDYIAFVDGDDYIAPDMIEVMVKLAKKLYTLMKLRRILLNNSVLTIEHRPIMLRSDFRKEDGHFPSSFLFLVKIPSFPAFFGFDISRYFCYDKNII